MKRKNLAAVLLLFLFAFVLAKETVGVGVVYDDEKPHLNERLKKVFLDELRKNFEGSNFEPEIISEMHAAKGEYLGKIDELQKNSKIDGIFLMSVRGGIEAIESRGFDKFVTAPFGGESFAKGKDIRNYNYIYSVFPIKEDVQMMSELKEVKNLTFFIPELIVESDTYNQISELLKGEMKNIGVEAEVLPIDSPEDVIKDSLDRSQAVYFILGGSGFEKTLEMAAERKIMTFSMTFDFEKNDGTLFEYDNSKEIVKRIRAASVNFVNHIKGETRDGVKIVEQLGNVERNIIFDMETARRIGIYPNLIFLQKVNVVNDINIGEKMLDFKSAMETAIRENPDLKRRRENIKTDEYNLKSSKSDRLPQIDAVANYSKIDNESAEISTTVAENRVTGGVELTQVIFDENINSNISIRNTILNRTKSEYKQEELDVILQVSEAYLTILEQQASLEIEKYNYELMKEYLKIAKTKYEVGTAGPEDIYRFESEIADSLTNIAEVKGQIKAQEAELNRVLNMPMSTSYNLKEIGTENEDFFMGADILNIYTSNPDNYKKLREYMVERGLRNSPEISQINSDIEAKEREYLAAKRERYLPKVNALAQIDKDLKDPWGNGSQGVDKEDPWSIGVEFKLPLFKGGDIEYTKQIKNSEIRALKQQKKSLENDIGKNVSEQFAQVVKDFIKTYTTKESADSARKNLELISDFYAKGNISISDLLDAKNTSVSRDLTVIGSKYNFLRSVLRLERSYGDYIVLKSDLEREENLKEIKKLLNQ